MQFRQLTFKGELGTTVYSIYENVQIGKEQEKAQSEKDSHVHKAPTAQTF